MQIQQKYIEGQDADLAELDRRSRYRSSRIIEGQDADLAELSKVKMQI